LRLLERAVWTAGSLCDHSRTQAVDVTAQFKSMPGGHEVVALALGPGTSTLAVSVHGTDAGGQSASHTDRLVFVRR